MCASNGAEKHTYFTPNYDMYIVFKFKFKLWLSMRPSVVIMRVGGRELQPQFTQLHESGVVILHIRNA